jgi:methylase of polypeptide subunit release factors
MRSPKILCPQMYCSIWNKYFVNLVLCVFMRWAKFRTEMCIVVSLYLLNNDQVMKTPLLASVLALCFVCEMKYFTLAP